MTEKPGPSESGPGGLALILLVIVTARQDAGTFRWRGPGVQGGRHALPQYHGPDQHRLNPYVANVEQRRRVLEVLGTLTGYHTRQVRQHPSSAAVER